MLSINTIARVIVNVVRPAAQPTSWDTGLLLVKDSLHCALPGNIIDFDSETQTASIQPAIKLGSLPYPVLIDVPVFMPIPFAVNPGDACLVIFSDVDIDNWFETGDASESNSPRRHSLSDGFAFVGWRVGGNPESGGASGFPG